MPSDLPPNAGPVLTRLAKEAIVSALAGRSPTALPDTPAFLHQPGAAFVTLTQNGELRGCIGSLEAYRPLGRDVQSHAVDAALGDPRFPPLRAEELGRTDIEVSVLSEAEPLPFSSREDLLSKLHPGRDGLILEAHGRRGTFLPQVWDQLPTSEVFLAHLIRKAGLPSGYWDADVRIWRYSVTAFEQAAPDGNGGAEGTAEDGGIGHDNQ
ncbi:MAG: AmmeMemoRadiSam system protein A [Bifidobacteriaceae bacterium]|jgi:AmmeMemoRadiSam system protein A|nr:AmmeMemoRadiSam system protein A [Bifidobacteriaceae bacterium]